MCTHPSPQKSHLTSTCCPVLQATTSLLVSAQLPAHWQQAWQETEITSVLANPVCSSSNSAAVQSFRHPSGHSNVLQETGGEETLLDTVLQDLIEKFLHRPLEGKLHLQACSCTEMCLKLEKPEEPDYEGMCS